MSADGKCCFSIESFKLPAITLKATATMLPPIILIATTTAIMQHTKAIRIGVNNGNTSDAKYYIETHKYKKQTTTTKLTKAKQHKIKIIKKGNKSA